MAYNWEQEIEEALNRGEEILEQQPDLYTKDCETLLNDLDDGTREMIHNRWGAAAWIAVKQLHSFEPESLVKELPVSYGHEKSLIQEYVGYLLQWKYQVNLQLLLLEAWKTGVVDQIAHFVISNLKYGQSVLADKAPEMTKLLEANRTKDWYRQLLYSYAELVENTEQQYAVAQKIGTVSNQAEQDLVCRLRRNWYLKNPNEVEEFVGRLFTYPTIWSKKTAIILVEESLFFGKELFLNYFQRLCELADRDHELWNWQISLWVRYANRYGDSAEETEVKQETLLRLHGLPDCSIEEKLQFVNAILFEDSLTDEIQGIFDQLQFSDFQKDRRMLELLDQYYGRMLHENPEIWGVWELQRIFQVNKYSIQDYRDFFAGMSITKSQLHRQKQKVTAYAMDEIVHGGCAELLFGFALFMEGGDCTDLAALDSSEGRPAKYQEEDWIRVMRTFFYFAADSNLICKMAFQILGLMENDQAYLNFCMEEIYGSFPSTMQELALTFQNVEHPGQKFLAELILKRAEQEKAEHEIACKIPDLWPSVKHQMLEARVREEQNREISKGAEKASLFASLFPSRTLKYGARSGYIRTGRKQEMMYQSNEFALLSCKMELPKLYVDDPVEYEMRKQVFLKEVERNASGH